MHSFLMSPQVTFHCRIINATSITKFDITIKPVPCLMCCSYMVCQFSFALEDLVTVVARDLHLSVDIPHVEVKGVFVINCFPRTLQTNSPTILMKYVTFLLLLGRPTDTDWAVITVGFDFEKPRNNSQNGSKNPPHATHFFGTKYTVSGGGVSEGSKKPNLYFGKKYLFS